MLHVKCPWIQRCTLYLKLIGPRLSEIPRRPQFLKESMNQTWNFQRSVHRESDQTIPGWEGYGYFLQQHIFTTKKCKLLLYQSLAGQI